ncbi:MAG: hypothetical protein JRH15_16730, partial [Deltaproteobacteria bacterium]|nr:hypothetical protein [Deltaproteobacteria bacterium]
MKKETMTNKERMEAVVKLEPVDRIPCAPLMDVYFPSRYKGWDASRGYKNAKEGFHAIVDVFDDIGGWDGMILPGFSLSTTPHVYSGVVIGGRSIFPEKGSDKDKVAQFEEKEVLFHDDYDQIIKLGWNKFREKAKDRFSPYSDEKVIKWTQNQISQYRYEIETWKGKGIRSLCGAIVASPMMLLSTSRTLLEFTKDIYQIPDKLEAVLDAMVDDLISDTIEATEITREQGVMLVMERSGCFYYPLHIYERFEYPYMKKMVEAFAERGLITVMHLDNNYTLNLPYFKDLPPKMVVAEFDSTTDIFKAKEILKGHMCIAGDVAAALTSLGNPREVENYCKKLIDIVGR